MIQIKDVRRSALPEKPLPEDVPKDVPKRWKDIPFEEAFASLEAKFTSGNDIPVERAVILRSEWEAIKRALIN